MSRVHPSARARIAEEVERAVKAKLAGYQRRYRKAHRAKVKALEQRVAELEAQVTRQAEERQ